MAVEHDPTPSLSLSSDGALTSRSPASCLRGFSGSLFVQMIIKTFTVCDTSQSFTCKRLYSLKLSSQKGLYVGSDELSVLNGLDAYSLIVVSAPNVDLQTRWLAADSQSRILHTPPPLE